jgi:hypothetical protein
MSSSTVPLPAERNASMRGMFASNYPFPDVQDSLRTWLSRILYCVQVPYF